jgi:hypothetical protein
MKSFFHQPFWNYLDWHWHGQVIHSAFYRELTLALLIILFLLFAAIGLNV